MPTFGTVSYGQHLNGQIEPEIRRERKRGRHGSSAASLNKPGGCDRLYQVLLTTGRPTPKVTEGDDHVTITVYKHNFNPEIIGFLDSADRRFQPQQKELITLGLIAQNESITAAQLAQQLSLRTTADLSHWIGRLHSWGLISKMGRAKGTEYKVDPAVLRHLDFKGGTTLKGIEPHRLRELVMRDLEIYREASISQIHQRIGLEIPRRRLQNMLKQLVLSGEIGHRGQKRYTVYLWTRER